MSLEPHLRLAPLLARLQRVEDEKRQRFALRRRDSDERVRGVDALMDARRSSADTVICAAHLADLDAWITGRRARCETAGARLEDARRELLAAERDRRTIGKLHERRRRAYEQAEARREEAELDEANARRRNAR